MADKRCFTKKITESDAFLEMPLSTQCLYFHLNINSADDDGFVNNPKQIARMVGCNDDDLKLLIVKGFVIAFESGVIVIKHWRMHNTLRNDRYHPTSYQEEFKMLGIKENGSYTLVGIPNGNQLETELNINKHNITKHNIKHKYGEHQNVLLTDEELKKLQDEFDDWQRRIDNLSIYMKSTGKSYKDHLATIRNWARKESPKREEDKIPTYSGDSNRDEDLSRFDEIMKGRK